MSSGMCPCSAYVLDKEFFKNICTREYQAFKEKLEALDDQKSEFFYLVDELSASSTPFKNIQEESLEIIEAYTELYNLVIKVAKENDLNISLCYHNTENGDCYDDVDGFFFIVNNAIKYTSEAEKYKQFIEEKRWTEFG